MGINVKPIPVNEEEKKIRDKSEKIKHKIAVLSGKGGVGKSSVAVNLAFGLAEKGYDVGIMDIDVHGPNIPKMLGLQGQTLYADEEEIVPAVVDGNIKVVSMAFLLPDADSPVIWRGAMKTSLIKQFIKDVQWDNLDYLIVDLPPGTGDEALTIAQTLKNDVWSLIVTTPQEVALLDSRKSIEFAKKLEMKMLGVVENMSGFTCPHCGKSIDLFGAGGGKKAAEDLGVPFIGKIPIEPEMVKVGDEGVSIFKRAPDNEVVKSFREITDNIIKTVEEEN